MMQTMQYGMGMLPAGSAGGHGQGQGHPRDAVKEHSSAMRQGGYSGLYTHPHQHPHPAPADYSGQSEVSVKEEPVDEEAGMVIDLTPRGLDPASQTAPAASAGHHRARAGYSRHSSAGYSEHRDPGYSEQTQADYPKHVSTGYSEHRNPGYSEHASTGYSEHNSTNYSEHKSTGYSEQTKARYPEHSSTGYSEHNSTSYSEHSSAGYSDAGGYPGERSKALSYSERDSSGARHHPYRRPAPPARDDYSQPSPGTGNLPSQVPSGDDGYSDSEGRRAGGGSSSSGEGGQNGIVTGTFRFSIPEDSMSAMGQAHPRARREFVPDNKKDDQYWNKRQKNNISARRSRVKRKTMEKLMEHRMVELEQENIKLKYELKALKRMFGDKVTTDLSASLDGFPGSSSSSGIGSASHSGQSSSGSADHSTSSSPMLHEDESKTKRTGFQLKVKLAGRDSEVLDHLDQQSVSPQSAPSVSPSVSAPVRSLHNDSPPAPVRSLHNSSPSPPAAHNSSGFGASFLPPAHTSANSPTSYYSTQQGCLPRPAHSLSAMGRDDTHSHSAMALHDTHCARGPHAAPTPHREAPRHSCSPCSSEDSVGPPSSTSGLATSEDDTSSSSGSRWSFSRGGQDDEPLHRIPLKCRMKRELHSAFQPSNLALSREGASRP